MPWPEPEVISTSSAVHLIAGRCATLSTTKSRSRAVTLRPVKIVKREVRAVPLASTAVAALANAAAGMRSGSLWPPMKLNFGKPVQRGAGGGRSLLKRLL